MINTGDIKRGVAVEVDGTLYQVVEVHHVKTKKSAVYKVKLRDLRAGHIIERTFNAGEKLTAARVERRDMQYLYGDADALTFMNTQTYDQVAVPRGIAGDALSYIKEGDVISVVTHGEEAISIELPASVALKIARSDPGVKGDTATGATKRATLETGLEVNVPLFINEGDTIKVSTSTGGYIERTANV
ncbi:MAG: elongation factor P [Dehalococcoidia bacterium]|nr:elongation factor P [Dehalococcoidia bacterium]